MTETGFWQRVAVFLANWRDAAADGLTWAEIGDLVLTALGVFIELAEATGLAGPDKKELVIRAFERLFDELIARQPLPWMPTWISGTLLGWLKPGIRPLVSGAIEYLVRQLKSPRPAPEV